jgi:nitroreductase
MADYADEPGKAIAESPVAELLSAAVAAPSQHNTQPWQLRAKTSGTWIEIEVDPARILPVGDPQGRAAFLACGAALLNVRVAAAANGLQTRVALAPDPDRPFLVAHVELTSGYRATLSERELGAAIWERCTNREPYSDEIVPSVIKSQLEAAAISEHGLLHFLEENEAVRIGHLVADAERQLLSNPFYRAELARWVGEDRAGDGIPSEVLGPRSAIGRNPVRDFVPDRPQPVRYVDFEGQPQLAVVSVPTDNPAGWIAAGQAMERIWLVATRRGLSVCPLTQPLETPDAWLVRARRHGIGRPQMILRVGYGPMLTARTPRRPSSDVVSWA